MAVILILLGSILIIFSVYSITREVNKKPTKVIEKNNFTAVLQDKEENLTDIEVLIGELRREFAETIIDLQKDIMEVKEQLMVGKEESNLTVNSDNSVNSVKINDVEKLLKDGYSVEDISEKLEIGKGEILLIKDLYLK